MKILKQTSGSSLRLRAQSTRGFLQGGNFIHATFQSMDQNGDMNLQVYVFTQKPSIGASGLVEGVPGTETEVIGVRIPEASIPAVVYDTKLTFVQNAQLKALPAVEKYLTELNPDSTFITESI